MTTIAGCVDAKGRVWLAGDASLNGKHTIQKVADRKVWRSGGVLFGGAGCWLALDLLRRIDAPAAPDEDWIRRGFPAHFNRLARELGCTDSLNADHEILLGACGRLWWCGAELALVDVSPYAAIGSGERTCLGSLYGATLGRRAVQRAIEAAAAHCPSTCLPIEIVNL